MGFRESIDRLESVGIMRRISMNITTLFINLHLHCKINIVLDNNIYLISR